MAVKVHENGFVEIKTEEDAAEAITAFHNLKAEIDELKEESGLNDLEKDAVAYKAAAQKFMIDMGLDHIQCDGFHGTLVKSSGTSHWVGTEDDMPENARLDMKPLDKIIEKKFGDKIKTKGSKARKVWMKITRRVVDPELVEELVSEGTLDVDEISPAWYETQRAPYLRVFEDE